MAQVSIEITGTGAADIRRCLTILYGTPVGSVALDREFGLDWNFVDLPTEVAKAKMAAEIIGKTRKYEPRVAVQEVQWETSDEGELKPKVVIQIV
ncbi:MAG: lysozyme [Clostridia bacterium]|nr:lysozyme [Clostridia bacterium]